MNQFKHTPSVATPSVSSPSLARLAFLGALALCAATFSATGNAATQADIEARYRLDVERCNTGQTSQDKATCLQEAGAARDEALRNQLTGTSNGSFTQNQMQRCNSLPAAQRDECLKQMQGENTKVMGSVESGGVLRETTITIPAPSPAPAPAASGSPSVQTSPVR